MAPLWDDSIADFEKSLKNGYALAHLARSLTGGKERIWIPQEPSAQERYNNQRNYQIIDNIDIFLKFVKEVGLSDVRALLLSVMMDGN